MTTNEAKGGINPLWFGVIGAIIVTTGYIYIYQAQPLASPWNDIILNFSYTIAAGLGAVIVSSIWQQFTPSDRPRLVWRYLALSLWVWTAGETAWACYYLLAGAEPPVPSWADFFWLAGYVFFTAALLYQYRLVFQTTRSQERRWVLGIVIATLVVTLLGTTILRQLIDTEEPWLSTCINVFYPIGDLAVAVVALMLVRTFGWGLWGRPWIALLVFTFSDALYAWLELSGIYSFLSAEGNPLSMACDVIYFGAYLVMALACYSQLLLLKYGPRLHPSS